MGFAVTKLTMSPPLSIPVFCVNACAGNVQLCKHACTNDALFYAGDL